MARHEKHRFEKIAYDVALLLCTMLPMYQFVYSYLPVDYWNCVLSYLIWCQSDRLLPNCNLLIYPNDMRENTPSIFFIETYRVLKFQTIKLV